MKELKISKSTYKLTMTALFVALMAISGTVLKIPLPPPLPNLSMQFFFSVLAGIILGPKLGAISMLVYLILGLLGLPIFTTGGGLGYIFYPSFGYILGFIGSAFISGFVKNFFQKKYNQLSVSHLILGCFLSLCFVYLCGVTYIYLIKNFYTHDNISMIKAIQIGMLSFIITDSLWCILAGYIGKKIIKLTKNINL